MVLVTLRLRGRGLTLASLTHILAAIHPAVAVAVGATGAPFAMSLTLGHALMALVLALLVLGMIGRLTGGSALRNGRRSDRKRERGSDDFHVDSPKRVRTVRSTLRRGAEGAGPTPDEGPDAGWPGGRPA